MAARSGIEWTEATWNPTVGCTKVSPGCKHCYARVMHVRLTAMRVAKYSEPFETVRPWEPDLERPLSWRKPHFIFVDSMSDLFHADVPDAYIHRVFDVMARADWHTFQVLTKRSDRLVEIAPRIRWPGNVWMGVSVESEDYVFRARDLAGVPAYIRFLSVEPLLGPIPRLPLNRIDWVIVGGESGPGARPFDLEWARAVVAQCRDAYVKVFVKQLGSQPVGDANDITGTTFRELNAADALPDWWPVGRGVLSLRDRKGSDINEFPEDLRVREWPR